MNSFRNFSVILISLFMSIQSIAQEVSYVYDSAGNCIERSIIVGKNKSAQMNALQEDYFVEESIAETSIKIYPNPTKGMLRVDFSTLNTDEKMVTITIYDMQGRLIYNNRVKGTSSRSVDLTSQPNGMYIMKIKIDASNESTWKIIKQG